MLFLGAANLETGHEDAWGRSNSGYVLFDGGMAVPIEAAAEDPFDDEVVSGCGGSYADANVDLPFGRDVQVGDSEDLLLLLAQCGKVADTSVVGIVLEAAADRL